MPNQDQNGNLEGKVALITGASRGIGRGIAQALAERGADIVFSYRTHPEEAAEVVHAIQQLGRQALSLPADVADRSAVENLVQRAVERFGHLDIAVANASYGRGEAIIDAPWEGVLRTFEVAQFGVFHTCQLSAQQMVRQTRAGRRGGKILAIGSVQALMTVPQAGPYGMAKAAINHLCRVLAIELAPYHINVNAINPGWIDTAGERERFGDDFVANGGPSVPWGRLGTPQDIGGLAAFLCSDAGDYITGASLLIDGGFLVGQRKPDSRTSFEKEAAPAGASSL